MNRKREQLEIAPVFNALQDCCLTAALGVPKAPIARRIAEQGGR